MKKNKCAVWILRLAGLGILAALAVYTAWNTGILSSIGQEDIYWERARFILGQGGATNYNGSSLCSLGYSLLLVPICAVLKSPYAAYKAAVLLNGGFLCLAYLVSLRTAKKLFPKENPVFLWAACLLAALCPALAASRSFTGAGDAAGAPYLVLRQPSAFRKRTVYQREAGGPRRLRDPGCFLQIAWLGAAAGVVILLGLFVKQKKVEETSFLYFCLAVLLGLAAGNIAERAFWPPLSGSWRLRRSHLWSFFWTASWPAGRTTTFWNFPGPLWKAFGPVRGEAFCFSVPASGTV